MKKTLIVIVAFVLGGGQLSAASFQLNSSQLKKGKRIEEIHVFNGFGCIGKNISPELSWTHAPEGTKGFAVTVFDPDAPTGSGWWHWIVVNIPVHVNSLKSGACSIDGRNLPKGVLQTRTDFGTYAFGGPCPPKGDKPHQYIFTVHALDVEKLPVQPSMSGAMVGFYIYQHTLDTATLKVRYSR